MHILVIRTSAMGDVALLTPVLRALTEQYPEAEITLLTRPAFRPFFYSIDRLSLFYTDHKERHKGFSGLIRLFKDLNSSARYDILIDLHDVLRSKVLRWLFRLMGVPSYSIKKGRSEKRSVISGKNKRKLKHTIERYCETFFSAGFSLTLKEGPWIIPSTEASLKIASIPGMLDELNIGIAPFARHKLKMWPEEYMLNLLRMIAEKHKVKFFFFGGNEESGKMAAFRSGLPGSVNTIGMLSLDEELALISRLDLMITMDSSNMHLAALSGTRVVSIWGGTDPLTGFGGWMQPEEYFIRIPTDELKCRPCTIYGKGECRRGDLACMYWLTPEIVFNKIEKMILSDYRR
jgi:ADP-heptose:LPS heptosyltransferase